ncbi:MAG: hypothetical protein EGR16_01870 [Clostridiales bacterium]|nr:hypothetical protein [Clostridiales bacterium]
MQENTVYKAIKDGESVFNQRADKDIERNRKGNFQLLLFDKDGNKIENADVEVKLKNIDFNFGANIFMLGQYDDEERNRLFEEKFCKLFNSAAVPLYWEGTEPEKGLLRYDADTKTEVYRRPPADKVMEFCLKHNIRMKGHPLFWHEFIPRWLPDDFSELKPYIEKRFKEISERYKDVFERFDVVNEPSRIYDVYMRDRRNPSAKYIVPEDDYCLWIFDLANRYFPNNTLILNDTVWASFTEFCGKYSGYYLNIKDLLNRGVRIDEIGMQCHLGDNGPQKVYNSEMLYDVLDTYATLGKPINISEVSIPSKFGGENDEELQALAAERLYKVCFSHPSVTGITWWNMPDDGVLTTKRVAFDENLPSTGLIDGDYNEKAAYKALNKLINTEWTTELTVPAVDGIAAFRGFFGEYDITVHFGNKTVKKTVKLKKGAAQFKKLFI